MLYIILGSVGLGILISGSITYHIFASSSRNHKNALAKAMRRAGNAKIEIEGEAVRLDPTSPDCKSGCMVLTDQNLIYAGHSGGELFIGRDSINKVEIATPVLGSDEYGGDTLLVTYAPLPASEESELLRIHVNSGAKWMAALRP